MPANTAPQAGTQWSDRLSHKSVRLVKSLARLQELFFNAVGLLTGILEEGEKGSLIEDKATTAARIALQVIGNMPLSRWQEKDKRKLLQRRTTALFTSKGVNYTLLLLRYTDYMVLQSIYRSTVAAQRYQINGP